LPRRLLKSAARSAVRSLLPLEGRRRVMGFLESTPIPTILARLLPARVHIEGCEFLVSDAPVGDPRTFFEMLVGSHESAERKLAIEVFKGDAALVDLGAGLGTVSVCAAAVHQIPYLVACEPNPRLYGLLRRNLAINRIDGQAVPAGIWYAQAPPALECAGSSWTTGRLTSEESGDSLPTVVPKTLAAIVKEHLADSEFFQLLCDIEGLEWQLFAHESTLLAERCLRMVVELHSDLATPSRFGADTTAPDELLGAADRLLEPLGFMRIAQISVVAAYERDS